MPISENVQCSITIMWFSTFGMIISLLLHSPLVFVFLFAFVFCAMSVMKSLTHPKQTDPLDEVELQPLEEGPAGSLNFKSNKNMTLGDILAKY